MKQLEFDDFSLTYSTEGEGSDILLLHGFPSNIFFWNSLKENLISNYRVTTVEQRGYPLSSLKYPKKEIANKMNTIKNVIFTYTLVDIVFNILGFKLSKT